MAALSDPIITTELLDTLRSQPHLPDDIWYLVIATTLCVLNRPAEIQSVYNHAVGPGHCTDCLQNGEGLSDQEHLRIVRRLREALLKTSAIGGMPKVIHSRAPDAHPIPYAPDASGLTFAAHIDHQRPGTTQAGCPSAPSG